VGTVIEETRHIPAQIDQVRNLVAEVIATLEAAGLGSNDSYEVKTALMEALTNAVKCQPDEESPAGQVWFKLEGQRLRIRVTDRGPGFDWNTCPDPTDPERLLHEGGRGVYLISRLMDRAEYNRESRTLTMEKHLSGPHRP
jgi:serine/threonine-protein kinase RsbW